MRNTRLKTMTLGDLNAQISAIRTGEKRLGRLLERVGLDVYRAACANIFEQARLLDRQAIAGLKDGVYRREGFLDDDGVSDEPVKIALELTIDGERMIIDLEGSSGPVTGSINCGAVQTVSLLRLAYKTMINPDRAITGGSFSTMEVRIPEECVFNAKEPAACEWYFTGLGLLGDLMISCLGEAMPERATAAHYGDSMVAAFFNMNKKDESWISVEATAGGWGGTVTTARARSSIWSTAVFATFPRKSTRRSFRCGWRNSPCALTPAAPDAGAADAASCAHICFSTIVMAPSGSTAPRRPPGAWRAAEMGLARRMTSSFPTDAWSIPSKCAPRHSRGTRIVTRTGGGGGYGDPFARPASEVLEDVRCGLVSREKARELYGVRIDAEMKVVQAKGDGGTLAGSRHGKRVMRFWTATSGS